MKLFRHIAVAILALALPFALCANASAYTMSVNKNASIYSEASTDDANKVDTLTFGTQIDIKSKGSIWSQFLQNGETRYILTENLSNLSYTIDGASTKLYTKASTSSTSKGYVLTGTKLKYVGASTVNGTKYLKVVAPKTYTTSLGKAVKKSNAIGYVRASKTDTYTQLKTVVVSTYIYDYAASDAPRKGMTIGNDVKVIDSNGTWSKVIYDGNIGYMYNSKLADKKLNVLKATASLRRAPSSDSTKLKTLYWNAPLTIISYYTVNGTKYAQVVSDSTTGYTIAKTSDGTNKLGGTVTKNVSSQTVAYSLPNTSSTTRTVYKHYRPRVVYDFGAWSSVQIGNDRWLYMLNDNLDDMTYTVTGKYYASVAKLRSGTSKGSVTNLEVPVIAVDKGVGYMKVKIDGKNVYMKTSSIASDPLGTKKMYINGSGPKVYEFGTTDSTVFGRVAYMDQINYIGVARTVSSGKYHAFEYGSGVSYIFESNSNDFDMFTTKKDKFEYAAANSMQRNIINKAKTIALDQKTDYSNSKRGTVTSAGVHLWDCSSLAGYLLNTYVRKYTGEAKWTIAKGTTSYTSSYCKARKISRTKYCLDGTELYPTTTLWQIGDSTKDWNKNLEPGDLLFFRMVPSDPCPDHKVADNCPDHVGVYLGNNQFIHATKRFEGVNITPLIEDYTPEKRLVKIMRFLPTDDYLAWLASFRAGETTQAYSKALGIDADDDEPFNPNDNGFDK